MKGAFTGFREASGKNRPSQNHARTRASILYRSVVLQLRSDVRYSRSLHNRRSSRQPSAHSTFISSASINRSNVLQALSNSPAGSIRRHRCSRAATSLPAASRRDDEDG
jgi:hypothetical protein